MASKYANAAIKVSSSILFNFLLPKLDAIDILFLESPNFNKKTSSIPFVISGFQTWSLPTANTSYFTSFNCLMFVYCFFDNL